MLALLRTRRWIGFTALVLGAIVAFGLLSAWQWSRAEDRRQERMALQEAAQSAPTPLAETGLASAALSPGDEWRPVLLEGRYLPPGPTTEAVVRKRPLEAQNGFWVMSALATDAGPVVWVNRGWIPAGPDALATPAIPPAPPGAVSVTGYVRAFEDADPGRNEGLPAGMVAAPAIALLPPVDAVEAGYVQLSSSSPAESAVVTLPLPEVDEGRNVSYAVQWLLFAAVAMAGWYFFLQREAREDAEAAAAADAEPQGQREGAAWTSG